MAVVPHGAGRDEERPMIFVGLLGLAEQGLARPDAKEITPDIRSPDRPSVPAVGLSGWIAEESAVEEPRLDPFVLDELNDVGPIPLQVLNLGPGANSPPRPLHGVSMGPAEYVNRSRIASDAWKLKHAAGVLPPVRTVRCMGRTLSQGWDVLQVSGLVTLELQARAVLDGQLNGDARGDRICEAQVVTGVPHSRREAGDQPAEFG